MSPITIQDLQQLIATRDVVIVEALPRPHFSDAHLPGARNLPLDEVSELAGQLLPDKAQLVVTYCTGRSCPNSRLLAEQLADMGYTNVRTFEGGKEAWAEAGLPLERSGQIEVQ